MLPTPPKIDIKYELYLLQVPIFPTYNHKIHEDDLITYFLN